MMRLLRNHGRTANQKQTLLSNKIHVHRKRIFFFYFQQQHSLIVSVTIYHESKIQCLRLFSSILHPRPILINLQMKCGIFFQRQNADYNTLDSNTIWSVRDDIQSIVDFVRTRGDGYNFLLTKFIAIMHSVLNKNTTSHLKVDQDMFWCLECKILLISR